MQTMEMNKKAVSLLKKWDPFEEGEYAYGAEIAAIVTELHRVDHPVDLAKCIRDIYEHTHEIWIPLENCMEISYKLIAIKYEAKSIVQY
ncbi:MULTISPECIES: DUF1871 family protein [Sporosarcina]|uniref:DUF1871 domain-containing protein n=1 Tax=Sporosarcina ureae TaxID=1571 RepID=A0ABM6JTK1_SPOUR|nr:MULTISPECIES: DUF1871 family protein [Sporosarcina]ARF13478.1 hypothetical protein SporoS204_04460 [Sporosarcina ureae]PIC56648.1 DUF1871 domain-containing protein [Sporosarcina sp. P10]PIC59864.1 DUF1871 domain-containing protein [Sporosarcina sp. P12(2017)]PIC75534.1 DUF1871 domain-containing protein [Sporosarcina sp. P19]